MSAPRQIDLHSLSMEQLNHLKTELAGECEHFQESLRELRVAHNRFIEAKHSLESLTPENEGKKILIPLTSSLYVPGRIADSRNVLVDIGTNYYAKKPVDKAQEFLQRKVSYLRENIGSIEGIFDQKKSILEAVLSVIQENQQRAAAASPTAAK